MKKSIYDLAYETVHEDGTPLTENQESEIDALVQFGKRVLENCRPTKRARDGAKSTPAELHCPRCKTIIDVHVVQTPRP